MGNAMSTYTAQNMGAGKTDRVRKGYYHCYGILMVFAVVLCIVMEGWGDYFIRCFLNEDSAKIAFQTGMDYVRFISYFYLFIGLKATTDGLLRGSGDMIVFTIANLINLGIRVSVSVLLTPIIGVQAVWYAIPLGWIANYIISLFRYLTGKWEEIRLIS
jgi:Na+-driven multidrug efflux pump